MQDSPSKSRPKLVLKWENVSRIDKNTNTHVLSNLCGEASSGDYLTIMGPSGAGKSSLLSILTSKLSSYSSNFRVRGKVLNTSYTDNSKWKSVFRGIVYLDCFLCASRWFTHGNSHCLMLNIFIFRNAFFPSET